MSLATIALPVEREQEQVVTLLVQICENSRRATGNQLDFARLHESIMQLEEFIFSLDRDQEKASALWAGLAPELIKGLNDAYRIWETEFEHQFAQRLIKDEARLSEYSLYERYSCLVRQELAMLPGFQPRRILLIGSGPLSISAIHLHLQTKAPVDCIARKETSVEVAQQALEKCGFSNSVRIVAEEEWDYDVSAYDLILVGSLAKPKKNILNLLRKHSGRNCKVLCRTTCRLNRLAYEETTEHDRRGFQLKGEQAAGPGQLISTLLLESAANASAGVRLEWLQEISPETAHQLLLLINRTMEEENTIGYPGPLDEQTGLAVMRQLDADITSGHRHVLVAYSEGAIVGQLILTPNPSPNHRHIVELTRGTIHPSFRGGGLPLRAFYEIARKCDELGREVICLDVRAGTHAAVLWHYFGFKQYGALADYARVGGKVYQGLYMTQTTAELKQRLAELASAATRQQTKTPSR